MQRPARRLYGGYNVGNSKKMRGLTGEAESFVKNVGWLALLKT